MKKLFLIINVVICLLCLNGCMINNEDISGIKIGFLVPTRGLDGSFCAVTSEQTQFKINDFAINFYYGISERLRENIKNNIDLHHLPGDSEYVSILWVVTTEFSNYADDVYSNYEDIINKENMFLIKEVRKEQLLTDDYLVTKNRNNKIIYNKYEKIQIPENILRLYNANDDKAQFLYFVPLLVQRTIDGLYYLLDGHKIYFEYQVAGDYVQVSGNEV